MLDDVGAGRSPEICRIFGLWERPVNTDYFCHRTGRSHYPRPPFVITRGSPNHSFLVVGTSKFDRTTKFDQIGMRYYFIRIFRK